MPHFEGLELGLPKTTSTLAVESSSIILALRLLAFPHLRGPHRFPLMLFLSSMWREEVWSTPLLLRPLKGEVPLLNGTLLALIANLEVSASASNFGEKVSLARSTYYVINKLVVDVDAIFPKKLTEEEENNLSSEELEKRRASLDSYLSQLCLTPAYIKRY